MLPSSSLGLRILSRTDDPSSFIAELYSGTDLLPQQRIDISGPTSATAGDAASPFTLEFIPLPGIQLSVRHMPGLWIVWLAVVIALVGIYALIRPPAVLAAQLSRWPEERTVVTLLATRQDDLSAIMSMTDKDVLK